MTGHPAKLREAIAVTLEPLHPDEIPNVCEVVRIPPGPPDGNPWGGKRRYVLARLMPLTMPELVAVARAVGERIDAPDLMAAIPPSGVRGVDGELKNLIFAARGPKPRIVLRDAINNVIEIVEHADKCLVYDRPLSAHGLRWEDLVAWWTSTTSTAADDAAESLYFRLRESLGDSVVEKLFFRTYCARYGRPGGESMPALIPQVYLYYDPYTLREIASAQAGQVLARQRMDFLVLLPGGVRVVIEIDGKQHYADGDMASPGRYAEMVAEDRNLRLAGYEIYRFGGAELQPGDPQTTERIDAFFDRLLARHR